MYAVNVKSKYLYNVLCLFMLLFCKYAFNAQAIAIYLLQYLSVLFCYKTYFCNTFLYISTFLITFIHFSKNLQKESTAYRQILSYLSFLGTTV
jgi:hypothetical protein